jgi:proteasome component ECM29
VPVLSPSASSLLGESSFVGSKTSTFEFRNALRPHLGKLLPRILRACYDPNKQTREQMSALWTGLTGGGAEGRLAISQHLLSTIDTLVEDAASKLWRARVGACGALSEIIVGREWSDLGGGGPILSDDDVYGVTTASAGIRLLRIWKVATRALDDVQGAVRDSGETLSRAIRALTIRLCDPSMDPKSNGAKLGSEELAVHDREATAAAATSLRWLIRHGLNQTCPEATGVCVSTLVEVVGVVRPNILEPSLPALLSSLLMAMSALEPAALNYLQLRTSDQEGLERARLQLAQTGPLAMALTKCLELVPFVKLATQQRVAPELDAALRQSAGFATRAATADAVSTLCSTCPTVFRFSGSSSTNPAVRLMRAFYFASERERGAGAKDKMIHALGSLAALCPASSVRSLALRACERYRASTGNNFDPASRRAAAAALRTIAVRASNHFSDGGSADIWSTRVLPVAFLGRKDSDPTIATLWNEVWEEGGSAANLSDASPSMNSFGTRLEEKLLQSLVDECVSALRDVSWSRRIAGSSALFELCDLGILSPVPRSTQSSVKTEATIMLRARSRAEASNLALQECIQLLTKPRLWTGKSEVLKAATQLAAKWAAAEASKDNKADEKFLFGWNEDSTPCPWRPLAISPGDFLDDLCAGDGWFSKAKLEVESEDEPGGTPSKEDDTNEDDDLVHIDFEQCDKILDETEDTNEMDTAPMNETTHSVVTFTGICRFLIEQAVPSPRNQTENVSEELLPYRTTAFRCFGDLLHSLPQVCVTQRMEVFRRVSPSLFQILEQGSFDKEVDKHVPPVLTAGAINCVAACLWDGIGSSDDNIDNSDPNELTAILKRAGGKMQPAWTVREAAAQCIAQLALKCNDESIRRHVVVTQMVDSAAQALTDRKFWRVRYEQFKWYENPLTRCRVLTNPFDILLFRRVAGLTIIESLTSRAGTGHNTSNEMQLVLEALLPHKELIVRLVRSSLSDSEAKVTALSSNIITHMSWWP